MDQVLLYFALLHQGDWFKIFKSIKNKEKVNQEKFEGLKRTLTSNYVTILSTNYPPSFRALEQPPYVIFYRGDYGLINYPNKIAIVGSRDASTYGLEITEQLVKDLVNNNYLIISGLAKGIDAKAHRMTLASQGYTIAIVGQGINYIYPHENKDLYLLIENKGLILSEYPDGVAPIKVNFPNRNRLIAALSGGVVITEAKQHSGTLTTVKHALNYGKDVFCVPYLANQGSACNQLIKQGAKLIETSADILEDL